MRLTTFILIIFYVHVENTLEVESLQDVFWALLEKSVTAPGQYVIFSKSFWFLEYLYQCSGPISEL